MSYKTIYYGREDQEDYDEYSDYNILRPLLTFDPDKCSKSADNPNKKIEDVFLREAISKVLGTLTGREIFVLTKSFGLDGEGEHSLREIGKMYGVCAERIRQIKGKALRKLRHPARSRYLKEFYSDVIVKPKKANVTEPALHPPINDYHDAKMTDAQMKRVLERINKFDYSGRKYPFDCCWKPDYKYILKGD